MKKEIERLFKEIEEYRKNGGDSDVAADKIKVLECMLCSNTQRSRAAVAVRTGKLRYQELVMFKKELKRYL